VWIWKHTEVYGEDLNLVYPKYEAQIFASKFTTLCTNRHDNGIIAGPEFLTLSPSDPSFSKELQPQQSLSTIHQYMYIQQDATLHSLFYLETALHVAGGTITHHHERKQLYLQHLVFVVEKLELV
jgi:hypothetical protein